jgi:dipeptidyl aminopeptidase/acylaminoacyl peptidase
VTGDGSRVAGRAWRRRPAPGALGERLRAVEVPDADGARERGWRIVEAAAAERGASRPARARRPRPASVAVAALVTLVLLALTPPGGAVADWVRDTIGRDAPPARVEAHDTLGSLPGGGRMLVQSRAGVWVVRSDGSRRLLGRYDEATWSPRGLFVGVTNDDGLMALTPGGQVRWALARRGAESPRWSPSGFRVAYRQHGALRVVAGDGTGDRLLARNLGAAAPAWQPAFKLHTLAAADRRGRVALIDADSGRRLWRSQPGAHPLSLAWSADGQRLLAVTPYSLRLFDGFGHELVRQPLPPGAVAGTASFAPRGRMLALVRRLPRAGGDEVVQMRVSRAITGERLVFRGAGRLGDVAWSPDGRWLAIGWPSADQWLFVRPGSHSAPRAAPDIARQFDPAAKGPAPAPAIAGWCCPS